MNPAMLDFPDCFETERLVIRAARPEDAPAVHQSIVESWDRLRVWMPWASGDQPQSLEKTAEVMRRFASRWTSREDLAMLVLLKDGSHIAGSGLHRINWAVPKFEIGYWLRTGYERQGYMTEAVAGITNFAFVHLGAKRVEIRCDALNERSAAIPRRLGFEQEACLRNDDRDHYSGELRDTLIFARLTPVESR
jgi:RimJ/RimL family protein N-acetyltransferase